MPKMINLDGDTYGLLTVQSTYMKVEVSGRKQKYCSCICECKNKVEVRAGCLRSGNTVSCGCFQKEITRQLGKRDSNSKDLTGKISGGIKYLERTKFKIGSNFCWRCECVRCGEELFLPTRYFAMGVGSCPKCGKKHSKGETEIETFLIENKIEYKREYAFKDLLSSRGGILRFDFAIFKNNEINYLIEYDGIQHFQPFDYFGGQIYLDKLQENDKKKNAYCKKHSIKLVRFKYDEPINFMLMN